MQESDVVQNASLKTINWQKFDHCGRVAFQISFRFTFSFSLLNIFKFLHVHPHLDASFSLTSLHFQTLTINLQ